MLSTLIAPNEVGYSLTHIKRALLSYDGVKLLSPDDRDIYPGNASMFAQLGELGGMVVFPGGQARPVGKLAGYDERFQKTLDELKPATSEGLIEVLSTYNVEETQTHPLIIMGGVPLGGYPLNVQEVHWIYRQLANNQKHLRAALDDDLVRHFDSPENRELLGLYGEADGATSREGGPEVITTPALPLIDGNLTTEDNREPLTRAARSRIGQVIKLLGYCSVNGLVPSFFETGSVRFIERATDDARHSLDLVDDDPLWVRKRAILDISYAEFMDEEALEHMSIEEVLRLRTKTFGRFEDEKTAFKSALLQLAEEYRDKDIHAFKAAIQSRLHSFSKQADELEVERRELGYKLAVKAGQGFTGALAGGGLANFANTALSVTLSPLTLLALLPLGALWLLKEADDIGPAVRQVRRATEARDSVPEIALYRRFSQVRT